MVEESRNKGKDESGVSNLKLITTTTGVRVSQACDRCRIKKIKCNGLTPCSNCEKIGFECKTSDKLTRRAFPKGYTENLEKKLKDLEHENNLLKQRLQSSTKDGETDTGGIAQDNNGSKVVINQNSNHSVQINNPIDQIFNVDAKGVIIGNDNLNFESQFNHLLINLSLPFLKITNSHNFLLNDPNSYLYNPSYVDYIQFHNRDLDVIYNPLTGNANNGSDDMGVSNSQLPLDVYDLFIKLINNFKNLFNNKKELDNQISQYFLNYNVIIPIFDYKQFMKSYDAFHTMYPFMFTYDDATINGFNLSSNDYRIVNEYLMTVIQIYAMLMMNNPTINLNLLLNNNNSKYSFSKKGKFDESNDKLIRSLYDFLPYFNVFHISVGQVQTYLLFLYYSLVTNNKEKSLILSSIINSFIGILGINLNSKNLFFNDLSLSPQQKKNRVMIFWVFKVLLKCFNLKFGFKPSLNTTVINPVTIERYFQLTPEKLSTLLDPSDSDSLFQVLLRPSVEFLNLVNIIIPSSFSPNYYQYLKNGNSNHQHVQNKKHHPKHMDWILNDDDGDGNDGNLNYNFTQFSTIDKNLTNWRASLKQRTFDLNPLETQMNLPIIDGFTTDNLYHDLLGSNVSSGITHDGLLYYYKNGVPDAHTAMQLVKIQLNFHYLLIRSTNYLNFVIDKELTYNYYLKIAEISGEVLNYFVLVFEHIGESTEIVQPKKLTNVVMESLGLDVDEDGFVINDFSVKRRKTGNGNGSSSHKKVREIPISPFNYMLNGLSSTIINFKKSIILQMLYQLICILKFVKRNEVNLVNKSVEVLQKSISLFIKVFINYQNSRPNKTEMKKFREDVLFKKLLNDELRDEALHDFEGSDDENEEDRFARFNDIDWDDEDMDEDIKYLKILKFIQYKSMDIFISVSPPAHVEDHSQAGHQNYVSKNKNMQLPLPQAAPNLYSSANSPTDFALSKVPSMSKFDFMLREDGLSNTFANPYAKLTTNDLIKREKLVANDLLNLKRASPNNRVHNNQWAYGSNES